MIPEPRNITTLFEDESAVRRMEVEVFRQIADGIKALNADMRDVRERLIRIESNQLDRTVKSHADRIDALERDRDTKAGREGVIVAILKSPAAAWVALLLAGAWAVITGKVHP